MAEHELWGPSGRVLREVFLERRSQDKKWGEQNHPDGTSAARYATIRDGARKACDEADTDGGLTWELILMEEVFEALAEQDARALREELIQVAAVATAWVEALDRRTQRFVPKPPPPRKMAPGPKQGGGGSARPLVVNLQAAAVATGSPAWWTVRGEGKPATKYGGRGVVALLFLGRTEEQIREEAEKWLTNITTVHPATPEDLANVVKHRSSRG